MPTLKSLFKSRSRVRRDQIALLDAAQHHDEPTKLAHPDNLLVTKPLSNKIPSLKLSNGLLDTVTNHNDLIPVGQCPPEILSYIFLLCVEISYCPMAQQSSFGKLAPVVTLSHVSQYWREVALSYQTLWGDVDLLYATPIPVMLARSGIAPVAFRGNIGPHNLHASQAIMKEAHRIYELEIAVHGSVYPSLFTNPLSAPRLEYLGIIITSELESTHAPLNHPVDTDTSSSLRYLFLHATPFTWVSPQYTQLTHIVLSHIPDAHRPSLSEFISVLRNLAILEHLSINLAFPTISEAIDSRVNLPCLKNIMLRGDVLESVSVLECLSFPPTAAMRLYFLKDTGFVSSFRRLFQALSNHFHQSLGVQSLQKLSISVLETSARSPLGFRRSLRFQAYSGPESRNLVLDFFASHDICAKEPAVSNLVQALWLMLPVASVREIQLDGVDDCMPEVLWHQLMSRVSNLCTIVIETRPPSSLLWALLVNTQLKTREGGLEPMYIPLLNEVHVRNVNLSIGGMPSPMSGTGQRFIDVLRAYLHKRRERGTMVQKLYVSACTRMLEEEVIQLGHEVTSVMWDGQCFIPDGLDFCRLEFPTHRNELLQSGYIYNRPLGPLQRMRNL